MSSAWFESVRSIGPPLQERYVETKTPLLHEGEVATKIFFIRQGCLRVHFNEDGREITTQFFQENQAATSLESFLSQTPSQFAIDCIEPCRLTVLTKTQFDQAMLADRSFQDWFYQTALEKLMSHTNRLFSFIRDTPQQRYRYLAQHQPELLSRVPQYYIASYLGITPVSLSRIKHRT